MQKGHEPHLLDDIIRTISKPYSDIMSMSLLYDASWPITMILGRVQPLARIEVRAAADRSRAARPFDPVPWRQRVQGLRSPARIPELEAERAPDQIDASTVIKNVGQRVAQSLIGMPLGGAIIGWLLDRLFDTAPWIMLALMFIGFAGAVLDVMRYSRQGSGKDSGK